LRILGVDFSGTIALGYANYASLGWETVIGRSSGESLTSFWEVSVKFITQTSDTAPSTIEVYASSYDTSHTTRTNLDYVGSFIPPKTAEESKQLYNFAVVNPPSNQSTSFLVQFHPVSNASNTTIRLPRLFIKPLWVAGS
jgi:hypothetical protein